MRAQARCGGQVRGGWTSCAWLARSVERSPDEGRTHSAPTPFGVTAAAAEPTHTFQPYLPRIVMEWRRAAPGALVQEREGSMVFVDVSGFTKMSERLARHGKVGAEEVTDVVGATFSSL